MERRGFARTRAAAMLAITGASTVLSACGLILGFDEFERVEGERPGQTSTTSGQGGAGGDTSGGGMSGSGGVGGMGGSGGKLLTEGSPCAMGAECNSRFCIDDVCCDTACDGACMACSAALKAFGNDGACEPILGGNDPQDECADETGTNACGRTGSCDGNGFCEVVTALTSCGDIAACSSGVQTGADLCDGSGNCVMGNDITCDPYVCDAAGTMCLSMCSTDADCISTYFCGGVACLPDVAIGTACQNAGQCQSGNCVDGYCCNTACSGTCQACSMAKKGTGNNGVCGPIGPGTDPDNECGTECMVSSCNLASNCSAPTQAPDGTPCGMGMMCTAGTCQ